MELVDATAAGRLAPCEVDPSFADRFRQAIGRFASGVTIVTTQVGDRLYGATVAAIASISVDPPMVMACLNRASSTGMAMRHSGKFALNILPEGADDVARKFACQNEDKFAGVDVAISAAGYPLLEQALAHITAEVTREVEVATHIAFFGEVHEVGFRAGRPLAYYRGRFTRLTP